MALDMSQALASRSLCIIRSKVSRSVVPMYVEYLSLKTCLCWGRSVVHIRKAYVTSTYTLHTLYMSKTDQLRAGKLQRQQPVLLCARSHRSNNSPQLQMTNVKTHFMTGPKATDVPTTSPAVVCFCITSDSSKSLFPHDINWQMGMPTKCAYPKTII